MLTAQWEIVADHARRALLWQPIVPLEEASHGLDLELADKGWALIYLKIDPFLEFVLPGQLFKTRVIKREDEPIAEVRVKVRDLSDAWTTPVALAWPPPDQEANQEATRLRATDFLPPSTLGLLGVVFVNTQRVIYPLECLDAQAHALQAELSALLLRITMQDYIKESGRFQQAQVCAHLLASRFYAYHVLHSAQESNDTVSPLASPTHESPVLLPSLTPVEPEQLPRPALLSISPQRTFLIPAAQPVKAVLEAIYAAQEDLWREQAGIPTYEVVKHAGKTIVQIRAEAAGAEPDEQMIHFLRQIVHALSDVDAVVFLALLGIHMASAPDEHGGHWVYVEDLAELRALRPKIHRAEGGKKRKAGAHRANLDRLSDAIDRINLVWLQYLRRGEYKAPINKLILIDSMFLKRSKLGFPTYYQTSVLAPTTREGRPYAYHFGIGPWLDSKRTPVAYIHQGVLRFRLHDRFWEERLLTYIYMHAGWQPQQVLRWQIRQLFAELKLPKEPERPWKTKQHFVEAMDRLKTADPKTNTPFIADWKFEEDIYPTGKDWFERWLDSSIVVTLPSSPLAPR